MDNRKQQTPGKKKHPSLDNDLGPENQKPKSPRVFAGGGISVTTGANKTARKQTVMAPQPVSDPAIIVPSPASPVRVSSPSPQPQPVAPICEDEEGPIPIKVEDGLEDKPYYHGLLPREDIESLIVQDGDFVVRLTEIREPGMTRSSRHICLSVAWLGTKHHFIIKKSARNRYYICGGHKCNPSAQPDYSTVVNLVNFYLVGKVPFGSKLCILKTPIYTKVWELKHVQIKCQVRIGAGAFGEVYSGLLQRVNKLPAPVAIKQLKTVKVDKAKIQEIMHEARVMRPLKHTNVVRCYGVAADIEPLQIVLELVNGGALDIYLRAHPNASIPQRMSMARDAACGLEYIHAMGILHRDVAARNCLYDGSVVKISDFGLSVVSDVYKIGETERTPFKWLAPEGFATYTYTRACDVWAYGVLLYEIFCNGAEPYEGLKAVQIREIVLHGGNLRLPEWVGSAMTQLETEIFTFDPAARPKMHVIMDRMKALVPRPEKVPEDSSEGEREHAKKGQHSQRNNYGGGHKTKNYSKESFPKKSSSKEAFHKKKVKHSKEVLTRKVNRSREPFDLPKSGKVNRSREPFDVPIDVQNKASSGSLNNQTDPPPHTPHTPKRSSNMRAPMGGSADHVPLGHRASEYANPGLSKVNYSKEIFTTGHLVVKDRGSKETLNNRGGNRRMQSKEAFFGATKNKSRETLHRGKKSKQQTESDAQKKGRRISKRAIKSKSREPFNKKEHRNRNRDAADNDVSE